MVETLIDNELERMLKEVGLVWYGRGTNMV
jgi:hypothetical protein